MDIQTISTKKLREDFTILKSAMEEGRPLLLLYRSRPLAEIRPIRQKPRIRIFSEKILSQWLADDELTQDQEKQIQSTLNRLP